MTIVFPGHKVHPVSSTVYAVLRNARRTLGRSSLLYQKAVDFLLTAYPNKSQEVRDDAKERLLEILEDFGKVKDCG